MHSLLHIVQYSGIGFAQVTNLVMLILIYNKAKGLFGSYRYLMTVFTAYSIVYTWIEMIALPLMYVHGSMFIMLVDSFLRYEKLIGLYVLSLYCASFALCISLLATQFYYRYVAVCQPHNLGKLNGFRLRLLFVPCILFFIAWFCLVFFAMKGTEEKVEYARKIILEVYEEDTSKIAFIALQFWDTDSDGSKTFRVSDWLSYSGFLSIIGSCFSAILFCAIKIYFKLQCSQNVMSWKTRELHRQLLKTLIFQTALPFFTMYSVVGTILSLPIFEIDIGLTANFPGSAACVYPALEPLIAMYFVKDFKNALKCNRGIRRIFLKELVFQVNLKLKSQWPTSRCKNLHITL
ncbi:Protein CBR-STR-140 [Caenorhabditis briggsae]|uniref:Serpentine receptor class r-10 n=1 Tax=Caenorhabditis briggsae TaxID=6238 RepID=A8XD60_CAEBR|nr:Protein CBR-STR-140 [Caenorhabditis briggsae]CAP30579.1 Protein CBR-STR-140 [Caenorhabditis briggsae]